CCPRWSRQSFTASTVPACSKKACRSSSLALIGKFATKTARRPERSGVALSIDELKSTTLRPSARPRAIYSPRLFTSCTPVGLKLRTLQPLGFASRFGLLISPTIGCTMLIAPGKPETVDVPAASSRSTVEVCGVSTPCVFGGAGSELSGMCASLKFSSDILILLILELCSNDPRHSAPAVNSQRLFPFHPPAADAVASYQSRRGYHPHQRPDEPWSACRRAHPG